MPDHTVYKYTDKDGKVSYTDVPPNLVEVKVVSFTGNTIGHAQTRSAGGPSPGEQSEATKRLNAERRARSADLNAKQGVLHDKIEAYGDAANKLNASRGLVYDDIASSNEALKNLDETQDRAGYAIAALSIIGTGILLVATAPAAIVVGGVLVIGAAVSGEANDLLRPTNEEHDDHPTAEKVKQGGELAHRGLESYESGKEAVEAVKLLKEGGTKIVSTGSKGVPIAGAVVTAYTAYEGAESTVANQIDANLTSAGGLSALEKKVEEFNPSLLEGKAGFDKDRLLKEIEATKEAQKEFDDAVREYEEARAAWLEAFHALNDTYVAPKGG